MNRGATHRWMRRLVGGGGVAFVALAVLGVHGGTAGAVTTVPYSDPNAVGSIGLCNQVGQQVTSGSTTQAPFAWLSVSTTPAQAPYSNFPRTAVLLAYQPRNGLAPGEWSGAELTASSRYTNPNAPMAAATSGDDSLADFMSNYHPVWNGFLQLRMYLGTADAPQYSLHYPSLDIQVQGNTWHAVGGSPVNCTAGTAESIESIVLPASAATTTPTGGTSSQATGSTGAGTSPGSASGSNPSSSGAAGSGSGSATPVTAAQSSSSTGWLATAVVIALIAFAAWFLLRRLRRGPTGDRTGSDPGSADPGPPESGRASPTSDTAPEPTDPDLPRSESTIASRQSISSSMSSSSLSTQASPTSTKGQHP